MDWLDIVVAAAVVVQIVAQLAIAGAWQANCLRRALCSHYVCGGVGLLAVSVK